MRQAVTASVLVSMKEKIFSYRKTSSGWEVQRNGVVLGQVAKTTDYAGPCWTATNPLGQKPGDVWQTWATREDAATALLPKRNWEWAHKYRFS